MSENEDGNPVDYALKPLRDLLVLANQKMLLLEAENKTLCAQLSAAQEAIAKKDEAIRWCMETYRILEKDGYHIQQNHADIGMDGIKRLLDALDIKLEAEHGK